MRQDVFVQNDSGAYSLLSSSVLERVIDDARENDGAFLKAHEAVLGLLVGDDSFVGRVVVGEPLSSDEASQWIARYRWALKVPCGKLLVCGGYDPDVLGDWLENGSGGDLGRGVGMVEVPPGDYLVDVYTYLHSMNGRVILEQMWDTRLGAWFREDHPGRAFPSWVAGELARFREEDPGHEKEWQALKESVEAGALKVETQPLDWVTFLFHLQPFDPKAELTEPEEGAWFGAGQGLRKPERFPLGVPATVKDPEYREALSDLVVDEEKLAARRAKDAAAREAALAILPRLESHALSPIAGGPLDLAPDQLARLYRLAAFTTRQALLGLRVRGPRAGGLAAAFEAMPGIAARGEGDELVLGFPPDGRGSWMSRALESVAAQGWTLLPSGSTIEFGTCPGWETRASAAGLLRFSGITRGQGAERVWEIREAFPRASASVLTDALALAAAAEDPRRLVLRSEEEAQQVFKRFKKHWRFMLEFGNKASRSGNEIRLAQDDPDGLWWVALTAFRHRHADVWPHEPEASDEPEDDGSDADE